MNMRPNASDAATEAASAAASENKRYLIAAFFIEVVLALILSLTLSSPSMPMAFADIDPTAPGGEIPEADSYPEVPAATEEQLRISLSPVEASSVDGQDVYKTRLAVASLSNLYGYQIQIDAAPGGVIAVSDLLGGVATEQVDRADGVYRAVMLTGGVNASSSAGTSSDAGAASGAGASSGTGAASHELCAISVTYSPDTPVEARTLTVRKLQVIKDIRTEQMLTAGPEPAAATLSLHDGDTPLGLPASEADVSSFGLYVALALTLLALILITIRLLRWRRQQARLRRDLERAAAYRALHLSTG
jgi:hypothetical protein